MPETQTKEWTDEDLDNKVAELMKLNWPLKNTPIPEEDGGGFSICIPLMGENLCIGEGETIFDAIKELEIILEDLLYEKLDKGIKIQTP